VIIPASDNEFAQLEREFNRMADYLAEQRNSTQRELERRLKAERQLRHSEHLAAVGRLAAGVAHEIGTPLNVIEVRAEQIQQDLDDSKERRHRNTTIILTQVERISNIVRQLLNLARPYKIHQAAVDLDTLVTSTLSMLEPQLQRAKVTTEFEPRSLQVKGDAELLRQVFINIFINAIHAMPDGGLLRITCSDEIIRKDDAVYTAVRIADNGIGIEETNLPLIFDPFYTTKDVGSGVGLGLPVSRRIIEEHNGWIEVASNPDRGVTFTVYLQRAGNASASASPSSEKEGIAR
jgi:signal transduction histidine kinase